MFKTLHFLHQGKYVENLTFFFAMWAGGKYVQKPFYSNIFSAMWARKICSKTFYSNIFFGYVGEENMFKKPMSLLALMLYREKRRLLVSLQGGIYTDVYYMKRNLFSALSVCITDGKVRDSLISGAGTGGGGTGSSVLGKLIAP